MARSTHTPLFSGRHFPDDVISLAIRWYLRFSLSYRDLEEIMAERGVSVDHSTIWRWVDRFAPELDRRLRSHLQPRIPVWRVDETYIRIAGIWAYLYRAVDARGATVEFYLSRTRDVQAATLFLRKAMAGERVAPPLVIVTDGNPSYPIAVREMQRRQKLPRSCKLRCSHAENNLIEQDHRSIQRRADAKQHFRSFGGASHTIAGYEAMHMVRKGQISECKRGDAAGQAQFIHALLVEAA
jgi:transposase-like protein